MSAHLLRLAAATLLVHINEVDFDDKKDWDDKARDWLGGPVGEFCALMSPKVALVTMALLNDVAENLDQEDGVVSDSTTASAVALAKTILREES